MWTTTYYTVANMDAYGEVVKEICDYFGVPVIDLRKCGINWQNKGYTLGDGVHPTAIGMDLMKSTSEDNCFLSMKEIILNILYIL